MPSLKFSQEDLEYRALRGDALTQMYREHTQGLPGQSLPSGAT